TTFSGSVEATDINNAASTTATFSDNVTATITNSGTLLFDTSADKSVTGTIAEAAGGDTTEIKVIDSADGAPATVTFTATVAADTLTVGTSSNAGAALFEDDVTVPTINITGGDVDAEDSTATFNTAVTSSSGITLDDNTGDAKVIFAENNSVDITGTIDGASAGEGTIQVTDATKTFSGAIGTTQALTLIDIDGTSIFNAAVRATDIDNDGTATFKSNVTAATANDGTLTLTPNGNNNITHTGAITGSGTLNAVEADDGAINSVTFSTDVTAGTFNVGSTTKSGVVILNGDTTVTNLNIYGGDANAEDSTVTVNGDLDTTTTTLDDGTNSAVTKIIFADSDTVTISGAITAATANDGTI
ncbi:MAG: hypothetical protein EBZ23_14735, partial [Rhodobacteraceae bacterium]|nr:hypothetical protein [Paracoccaceae bacterium]